MALINSSIYIIPNSKKMDLLLDLSKENTLNNIKYYSLEEVVNKFGSYDEKSLPFLMEKYGYKYNNAKKIISNLKYIENKKYNNKKLDNLVKIKEELKDYYQEDEYFLDYIKDKYVLVTGYDYIDNYSKKILDKINANIEYKEINDYKHIVYGFNTIFEEVSFVASKIRELLDNEIDINKIKIVNYSNEYNYIINIIFNAFNININLDNESIYSTYICQKFLNEYFDNTIEFKDSINLKNEDNLYIYNKIIGVINKYNYDIDSSIKKEIFINEFKNIKCNLNKYLNKVEIKELNSIKDDEYAFLIGFNEGTIPRIYKDEDYLSDKEKELLGLEKSYERTNIERELTINNIKSIKNLVITYKLRSSFDEYFKSTLIEDLGYEEILNEKINYNYSDIFNKLVLGKKLDNLVKYGEKNDDLELLFNNYLDNDYLTFDNKYKKIDKDKLYEYLKNELTLSYSSIDNYYKCKFRYYLNNILKLDKYEETFAIYIGNLFHYVLSKAFEDNFDLDKEYYGYIDKELSIKEKYFIDKLKNDLEFIINTIKKQYSYSEFNNALYENKFSINKDSIIKVNFIGFIDKLLYKEHKDKTLLVIIDYKTGTQELNLNNSIYGLNLQLPVYLYLSKNSDIKNAEVVGFYLQKILNNEITKNNKKTYEKQKEDNLKLQGYSIYDVDLISIFDRSYAQSEVIKSLGTTKDGFRSYSKLLTKDQMDELYKLVDNKIDEARDNILEANFDIDPKKIGFNNVSCKYCKYKDICFMTENDINVLEEVKDLSFLGGADDAKLD